MTGKIYLQRCNFLIVGLLLAGMLGGLSGCNLLNAIPDKQDQTDGEKDKPAPGPGPAPAPTYKEADYWNALADLVEAGRFTNTDQIVLVVASQKTLGNIKDDSRIGEYQQKRQDVTDGNKAFIANKIRGN